MTNYFFWDVINMIRYKRKCSITILSIVLVKSIENCIAIMEVLDPSSTDLFHLLVHISKLIFGNTSLNIH